MVAFRIGGTAKECQMIEVIREPNEFFSLI